MKLGTLVSVHGDRAAVVWIWRGFACLARRSSQKGEAVDDDCGMVVFQFVLIGPRPIGNVTDHVKRITLLDVLLDHVGLLLAVHDQVVPGRNLFQFSGARVCVLAVCGQRKQGHGSSIGVYLISGSAPTFTTTVAGTKLLLRPMRLCVGI